MAQGYILFAAASRSTKLIKVSMYIIAIAWMYVVILMAATEKSFTAGFLTFTFYGALPCALFLWVLGAKHRRHHKQKSLLEKNMRTPDSADAQTDE